MQNDLRVTIFYLFFLFISVQFYQEMQLVCLAKLAYVQVANIIIYVFHCVAQFKQILGFSTLVSWLQRE